MKKGLKIFLIVLAVILILLIITGIVAFAFVKDKLNKINYEEIDTSSLSMNENLINDINSIEGIDITQEEFDEIKTIAIFGSDSRNIEDTYDDGRSDCIIIATINPSNKSISLVSIPRDTYVNVPGHGKTKINHAFAYGQEQLSIKTINENFGLNISEYITVSWEAVVRIVDMVGGIDLEISEAEKDFINNGVDYTATNANGSNEKLVNSGKVHLNGTQVLVHCRNRFVGNNDFARAERQRTVITTLLQVISQKSVTEINKIIDEFLPYVKTNIDVVKYSSYIPDILKYKNEYLANITSAQVPALGEASGQYIGGIYYYVPSSYEKCKQDFIKYLYGNN